MVERKVKTLSSQVILLANIIDRVPHDTSLVPVIEKKSGLPYSTPHSATKRKFTHFDCWTVPHYYETLNTPEYGTSLDFPGEFSPSLTDENYLIPNYNEKNGPKVALSESNSGSKGNTEKSTAEEKDATPKEGTESCSVLNPEDFDLSSQVENKETPKKVRKQRLKRSKGASAPKKGREVKRDLISIKDLKIDLIESIFPRNNPSKRMCSGKWMPANPPTGSRGKNGKSSEGNYCSRQEYDALVFYIESLQVKYNILFCFTNQFEQHTKFNCDQLEKFVEIKKYCVLMLLRLRAELGDDYASVMEYIYGCNNVSEVRSWADVLFGINRVDEAESRRIIVQNLLELYKVNRSKNG